MIRSVLPSVNSDVLSKIAIGAENVPLPVRRAICIRAFSELKSDGRIEPYNPEHHRKAARRSTLYSHLTRSGLIAEQLEGQSLIAEKNRRLYWRVTIVLIVVGALALMLPALDSILNQAQKFTWVVPPPPKGGVQPEPSGRSDPEVPAVRNPIPKSSKTPAEYYAEWDREDALRAFSESQIRVVCPRCESAKHYSVASIEEENELTGPCRHTFKLAAVRNWIEDQKKEINRVTRH